MRFFRRGSLPNELRDAGMGFALSLVYLVLALLSPAALLGEVATEYHIQIVVALVALLASLPLGFRQRSLTCMPHLLLGALVGAVGLSLIANHWLGGALLAVQAFVANAVILCLVLINCTSFARLRVVVGLVALIAGYFALRGAVELRGYEYDPEVVNTYIVPQNAGENEMLLRIRGVGFLSDPNDLAQLFVSTLPFLFLAWKRRALVRNLFLVIVPAGLLLAGIFLTHSRGAVVALAASVAFAFRKRIGTLRASILGVGVVVLLPILNFTGQRNVSLEGGADRLELWANGWVAIKDSPLFGIGWERFADRFGLTAHNSFVVTAAELGFFGYFWWIALLVFTFDGLARTTAAAQSSANQAEVSASDMPALAEVNESGFSRYRLASASPTPERVLRWAEVAQVALVGFLVAGLFLSRAYVLTLYLLLGIGAAVSRITAEHYENYIQPKLAQSFLRATAFAVGSLVLFYLFIKVNAVLHLGQR